MGCEHAQLAPHLPRAVAAIPDHAGRLPQRTLLLANGSLQLLPWQDWLAGRPLSRTLALSCLPTVYVDGWCWRGVRTVDVLH